MNGADRCHYYAESVVEGETVAPLTVIQACRRHLEDLEREDLYFDDEAARKAVSFIENLPHTKGKWAKRKEKIKLQPWQCFYFGSIFGWKRTKDDLRRFRYAYVQVPRKNGKSIKAAGTGLIMFAADGEFGAEVYCGATKEKQAWEVFRPAKQMCERTAELRQTFDIEVNAKALTILSTGSRFEPVVGKPGDGSSPNLGIVDEYHEHTDSDLYDTFDTGVGARDQPLMLVITTAGSTIGGPCHEMYMECRRQILGEFNDDSRFVLIYEPDDDDAWDDPATLAKVNPNFGISVNEDFLLNSLEQAKRSSSKQNIFRKKHLNQWVGARTAWMNMLAWQRQKADFTLDDVKGWPCYLGIDLASKIDLAAVVALFRNGSDYRLIPFFFAPDEAVHENDKYQQYVLEGAITATPGSATDYAYIEQCILDLYAKCDVLGAAMDPHQAEYLRQRLEKEGKDPVEFRQTVLNMSDPMKELEKLVLDRTFEHDGNPCMTWNIGNVMARMDEKENIYPTKEHKASPLKIDGAVAAIMALGMWINEGDQSSLYSRGLGVA